MSTFPPLIVNFFVFIYTIIVHADAQGMQSETFVLNMDIDAHPDHYLQLPLKYIPTLKDQNVIRACPAEKGQDKTNLSAISKKAIFHENQYCLFQKSFSEGQSMMCTEEVKPLLRAEIDRRTNEIKSCGFSSKHLLYSFGFYYCGEPGRLTQLENRKIIKHPLQFELETYFFPIYQLCVDTSTRLAVWTKHSIMTPAIFKNSNEAVLQQEEGDESISIDDLLFKGKNYESKRKLFDNQSSKSPQMIRSFMVPREHVALNMWKKTVNHYIIIAPLWNRLQLLMAGIDQVIKKLALILHSKKQLLTIYTKVTDTSSSGFIWGGSVSNTWYKLLHEKTHNSAVLIVIQNTPKGPPGPKIQLCETRMQCNMKSWYSTDIPEDTLQYAACCIPSTEEIKRIFNVYLDIAGNLDIDNQLKVNYIDNNQPVQSHKSNPSSSSPGEIIPTAPPYPSPTPPYPSPTPFDAEDQIKKGRKQEREST